MTKAYDFVYDGVYLSDRGFILCNFNGGGVETVSNGCDIEFNTVPTMNGMKHEFVGSSYEDCMTATLQICKDYCNYNTGEEISVEEAREITKWLNRKKFHKLRFVDTDYSGIYFEASFNVSRIEIDGRLYGFELNLFTNRPFAVQDEISIKIDADKPNTSITITSESDEEGSIYPQMEITIKEDGDLNIYNEFENRNMTIANCKAGEVITVNYPIISSSISSHKIQNDFNWIFFRIATAFKKKNNEVTVSLPCSIYMTYSPIAKVSI